MCVHTGGPLISWHLSIVYAGLRLQKWLRITSWAWIVSFCLVWSNLVALLHLALCVFICDIRGKHPHFSQAPRAFCVQLQHSFSSWVKKTLWYLWPPGFSLWKANKKMGFQWKQIVLFCPYTSRQVSQWKYTYFSSRCSAGKKLSSSVHELSREWNSVSSW